MEGAVLGPYRLVRLLGRGGMGEVWHAVDTAKDRDVALKLLGTWLGGEHEFVRRFRREAALAARLTAPHILAIHDYGEVGDQLFIDMPLVDGTDLGALLARAGSLPPNRCVDLVEQIADALDTAHEAGLVHRDVKPSNVLLTRRRSDRDHAYLIDFGIARPVTGTRFTVTGQELGTLAYMAPERFSGAADRRSDVYALACLLYAMLTGQPPFVPPPDAHELGFYVNAHLNVPPPRPSSAACVPPGLDAVVARGMAKQPDDRPAGAGDLAVAARAALDAEPVAAPATDRPVLRVSAVVPFVDHRPSTVSRISARTSDGR